MVKLPTLTNNPQVPDKLTNMHKYLKYNTEISKMLKDMYA